jgi:hypothetical protein
LGCAVQKVDRGKLSDNKVMRFMQKIASQTPAKGREKRCALPLKPPAPTPPSRTPTHPAQISYRHLHPRLRCAQS